MLPERLVCPAMLVNVVEKGQQHDVAIPQVIVVEKHVREKCVAPAKEQGVQRVIGEVILDDKVIVGVVMLDIRAIGTLFQHTHRYLIVNFDSTFHDVRQLGALLITELHEADSVVFHAIRRRYCGRLIRRLGTASGYQNERQPDKDCLTQTRQAQETHPFVTRSDRTFIYSLTIYVRP